MYNGAAIGGARRMLIATGNTGKVAEYRILLSSWSDDLVGLGDLGITATVEENGSTFAENALLKARFYSSVAGQVVLADDSGLEVDALGGRPGVRSARYGGPEATDEDRYLRLLAEMEGIPADQRGARFRCAIAVAWPDGHSALTTGTCEGEIALEPRGSNGFGYDPVFLITSLGFTMAELPPETKNAISHRARAALAMLRLLRAHSASRGR